MAKEYSTPEDILTLDVDEQEALFKDDTFQNEVAEKDLDFWTQLLSKLPESQMQTLLSNMDNSKLNALLLIDYNDFYEFLATLNPPQQKNLLAYIDPNYQSEDEEPLLLDALQNNARVTGLLIEHCGSLEVKNQDDVTPLIVAAGNGRTEMVIKLLARGAKPDDRDRHNNTALIYAIGEGHYEIALILARKGVALDLGQLKIAYPKVPQEKSISYKQLIVVLNKYILARIHHSEAADLILDTYKDFIKTHTMDQFWEINNYEDFLANVRQNVLFEDTIALFDLMTESDQTVLLEKFDHLCRERAHRNDGTLHSFPINPFTASNDLHFKLARHFHPHADFLELFKLLLPHITIQWVPRVIGKEVILEKKDISSDNGYPLPLALDSFTHIAVCENGMLILDSIVAFSVEEHRQLSDILLKDNPTLHKEITYHNETTLKLYTDKESRSNELLIYTLICSSNKIDHPDLAIPRKMAEEEFDTKNSLIDVKKELLGTETTTLPTSAIIFLYPRLVINHTYKIPYFFNILPKTEYRLFILSVLSIYYLLCRNFETVFQSTRQKDFLIDALVKIAQADSSKTNDCLQMFLETSQFKAIQQLFPDPVERVQAARKYRPNILSENLVDMVTGSEIVGVLQGFLLEELHFAAVSKENSQGVSVLSYYAETPEVLKPIIEALPENDRFNALNLKNSKTSKTVFQTAIRCNPEAKEALIQLLPKETQSEFRKMVAPNYSFSFWATIAAGVGFLIGTMVAENETAKTSLFTAGVTIITAGFFATRFAKIDQSSKISPSPTSP